MRDGVVCALNISHIKFDASLQRMPFELFLDANQILGEVTYSGESQ